MKKRKILTFGIIVTLIISSLYFLLRQKDTFVDNYLTVENSSFEIVVMVTGELRAENSQHILGPSELQSRNIRLSNISIQDLVPEGTLVRRGDYVATLDRSESDNELKDLEDALERAKLEYSRAILDTTIQLSSLRDDLINLIYNVEERKLTLDQSIYEPPATIRQAEINLERAERALEQAEQTYELRRQQAIQTVSESALSLSRQTRRYEEMMDLLEKFVIYAPSGGMVIYHREWSGAKRTVGSTINARDLAVATLPDLTTLLSVTYVNEIDIDKIRVGHRVRIGVDAFPDKNYTGEVIAISNVGEQVGSMDAKVFEVQIRISTSDDILKPAMTTSNMIVTKRFENIISIPLGVLNVKDNITYVTKVDGTEQYVRIGDINNTHVVILEGLEKGDKIMGV